MKLVADANILFSAAKPGSSTNMILEAHSIRLFSPDHVLSELEEHKEEFAKKAGVPYREAIASLKEKISFRDYKEYAEHMPQALSMLKDPEDAPYLALAIKMAAPIWSNDAHLKGQTKIPVFTTAELVELLAP